MNLQYYKVLTITCVDKYTAHSPKLLTLINMPNNAHLLIVFSTVLAYFLKVIAGFGASLILVPVLSSGLDMKTATILACLGDIVSSGIIFKKFIKDIKWKIVSKVCIGLFAGTFIGVSLFTKIDAEILRKYFGLFILAYVLLQIFNKTVLKKRRKISTATAPIWGLFAGITGGIFNVNGPLLVIFMNNALKNKDEIRANLMTLFFLDSIWRGLLFLIKGNITLIHAQTFSLIMLPTLLLTLLMAFKVDEKIKKKQYNSIYQIVLFLTGIRLILA